MNHDDHLEPRLSPDPKITALPYPPTPEPPSIHSQKRRNFRSYLTSQLKNNKWMSAMPILCFFISGLIDAVALNTWGCFVGMQTGNTVFIGLGIAPQPVASHSRQWTKSLTAIGVACLGCAFFNFLHRYPKLNEDPSSRKRWVLILSWVIQCTLITIAAILTHYGAVSNQPAIGGQYSSGSLAVTTVKGDQDPDHYNYVDLVAIALLAFQSGGPVCLSRILRMPEFPTIAVSSVYHTWTAGLFGMRQRWRESISWKTFLLDTDDGAENKQLHRTGAICALFLGAVVTGQMYKTGYGVTTSLFVAVAMKGTMTMFWVFWPSAHSNDQLFCRCAKLMCSICGLTELKEAGGETTPASSSSL